jgi:hypothetical protein
VPIGTQEAVGCRDCSLNVDGVDRRTAPLASEASEGKGSGSLRRMTVFVRYENVVRLLEFLGYQLE